MFFKSVCAVFVACAVAVHGEYAFVRVEVTLLTINSKPAILRLFMPCTTPEPTAQERHLPARSVQVR